MRVLIIPEDQELDAYIVRPVVQALFDDLGVSARVGVLPEPRLRGAGEALNARKVSDIVRMNPMEDLFLLIVDGDCNEGRNYDRAAEREKEHQDRLIACVAREEVEVWMLALYRKKLGTTFKVVRSHCHPKERWARPLLDELGSDGPGGGRKNAMQALKRNWHSLRDTCTELRDLQEKVKAFARRR